MRAAVYALLLVTACGTHEPQAGNHEPQAALTEAEAEGETTMSRKGRNGDDFFDYDNATDAELARLAHAGLVDIDPPLDASVIFDPQFERRARELNRTPFKGVQGVSVVEQKQGPWSSNPQLGIEQPFAPASNNEQTILKLDEWGMPRRWQVTLGLAYTDLNASAFDIQALVNFGAGGVTQVVEVDWENGVSFPLTFNALNIIARFTNTTNLPEDLALRVSIGHYGGASDSNIARAHTLISAAAGNSDIVAIPKFARKLRIFGNTSIRPDDVFDPANVFRLHTTINFATSTTQVFSGTTLASMNGAGIPILSGNRFFTITNNTADLINGRIIWDLST